MQMMLILKVNYSFFLYIIKHFSNILNLFFLDYFCYETKEDP